VLLAVATVLVLLVGGVFAGDHSSVVVRSNRSSRFAFGSFAGYVWIGRVRSATASWVVPPISPGSPSGAAGTWVGALAPGSPAPFIQLGTLELRGRSSRRDAARSVYYAFWADTSHGYHARPLFAVGPGNDVVARLMLAGGRWRLSILDKTSGAAASFSTAEEARASFITAEWLQEDAARTTRGIPSPYPRLANVGFRQVAVNSAAPSEAGLNSVWMSVNGTTLAPTPLRDGFFRLHPAPAVSSAGSQYLRIAEAAGVAEQRFLTQLFRWSGVTRRSQIASASSAFLAALRTMSNAIADAHWPTAERGSAGSEIHAVGALIARTRTIPHTFPSGLAAWRSALLRNMITLKFADNVLRRSLDIPATAPRGALAAP
jgi:hypothetical protein